MQQKWHQTSQAIIIPMQLSLGPFPSEILTKFRERDPTTEQKGISDYLYGWHFYGNGQCLPEDKSRDYPRIVH